MHTGFLLLQYNCGSQFRMRVKMCSKTQQESNLTFRNCHVIVALCNRW
jgi:hypothetical protein